MVLSPRSGRRQLILSCAAISLWRLSSSGLDCRVLWSQECSRFCFSLSHTHTCMHTLSFSLIHHRPPPPPPPHHTHTNTPALSLVGFGHPVQLVGSPLKLGCLGEANNAVESCGLMTFPRQPFLEIVSEGLISKYSLMQLIMRVCVC